MRRTCRSPTPTTSSKTRYKALSALGPCSAWGETGAAGLRRCQRASWTSGGRALPGRAGYGLGPRSARRTGGTCRNNAPMIGTGNELRAALARAREGRCNSGVIGM
jgi:hypothetical protein